MGTIQVHTLFDTVQNLAVHILLGITYRDHSIKGIFPTDRKIMLIHSGPVPILGRERDLSKKLSKLSHNTLSLDPQGHATIQVAKTLTI